MKNMVSSFRIPLVAFFSSGSTDSVYPDLHAQQNSSFSPKRTKKLFKNSRYLPFAIMIFVVVVIGIVAFRNVVKNSSSNVLGSDSSSSVQKVAVEKPRDQEVLNREFLFPIKDAAGKEVSKIKYEIQNVELRDKIIIKGQQATAVEGRTFLIVNLKITNSFQKSIQINARDYLRLIVNGAEEKLAPDIHNDPVEVQAISTKYTRLGFPIDDSGKSLTLQIGEISGNKDFIQLSLK